MNLLRLIIRPRDFRSRDAFENAAVVVAATGGSTTVGLLHGGALLRHRGSCVRWLSDREMKQRRKVWKPRKPGYSAGALWKYAELVSPAVDGAVMHPSAKKKSGAFAGI